MESGKYRAMHSVAYIACTPIRKITGLPAEITAEEIDALYEKMKDVDVKFSHHTVNAGDVISVSFADNCAICDVGKYKIKVEPEFVQAHFEFAEGN